MGKSTTPKNKPAPKTQKTAVAGEQGTNETTYDLDSLAEQLGEPDTVFAARTFTRVDEAALVREGARVDSQNVLDDMPRFAGSALEITASLTAAQQEHLLLPSQIYPLLIHEAVTLRQKKAQHDQEGTGRAADKANRETAARAAMVAGIARRDAIYDAVKNALGAEVTTELDAVVGHAASADALAKGQEALATFIDRKSKASPETAARLADYKLGPATADQLRAAAKSVRTTGKVTAAPGRRVTQRALDLQDGRVLLLVDKILRAFRAARRIDPTILKPELNKLAWMFEKRSKAKGGGSVEAEQEGEAEAEAEAAKLAEPGKAKPQ